MCCVLLSDWAIDRIAEKDPVFERERILPIEKGKKGAPCKLHEGVEPTVDPISFGTFFINSYAFQILWSVFPATAWFALHHPFGTIPKTAPRIVTLDNTNVFRYYHFMAIRSFKCSDTRDFFAGRRIRRFTGIESAAMRKMAMLNRAGTLKDLRIPPGNQLEPLKGNREGQFSIRINDRYRLCFVWTKEGPKDVEIADYH